MIDEAAAWDHLDALAKPRRSLGKLEALAVRLACIQQRLDPVTRPRRIVLFAADHGVVAQGVSAWPSDVTGLMVATIAMGRAASNALAAAHGCDLRLVDMGVASPPGGAMPDHFRDASLGKGSADLATGPALTLEQFDAAWGVGAEEAERAVQAGVAVLIAGEMGIGNTTPAACLTALLADVATETAVGPGAGADAEVQAIKQRVVREAVVRARSEADPRAAIASVAGFEIAAMAGYFAAGAAAGATLLLDGYVATAAALIAERLAPGTARAMIAAHRSAEPGHGAALAHLGLEPLLDWEMRLGEGTGALVALPLLDSAAAILCDVASLADLGVGRAD
ncbi:nicotinate-nucleotide--dimethylbenzimidazole phosphoribosyltransferase [Sphingomonas sp. S1-29]|uniref:nicotinate-nucleotide--dimethylbenzimidazole phosphoribosyltransferase n=1 Tax=Sphingomonas sp. S1-29 TaxID=2991074 RepID=UPI002240212F|nr:nicotinate-nucleotide--dimethylbenzimidazole phosphoribosyltransferase [Sphingomonas sp. S1-29]UZK69331.1 nicotinate-nucleotide--dimethylbenzimidazole phosphoribosyltransferase [Sphingomonas sp. S1-29]